MKVIHRSPGEKNGLNGQSLALMNTPMLNLTKNMNKKIIFWKLEICLHLWEFNIGVS